MFLKNLLHTIGMDFKEVFAGSQNAAELLTEDEKNAQAWVSGAIAVISQNPKVSGDLLTPIIQSFFPNVDIGVITTTLVNLAQAASGLTESEITDLNTAISVIQHLLSSKQDNAWIVAIQGLVNLGAVIVSPSTPIQKFVAAAEYVYQDIVKPLLGLGSGNTLSLAPIASPASISPIQVVDNTAEAPAKNKQIGGAVSI